MAKVVRAKSFHTIHVSPITEEEFLALGLTTLGSQDKYTNYYVARNWDKTGCVFFYLAKGYHAPHIGKSPKIMREIHVWYPNSKKMWTSMGYTFEEAINGAQRDGWLYA